MAGGGQRPPASAVHTPRRPRAVRRRQAVRSGHSGVGSAHPRSAAAAATATDLEAARVRWPRGGAGPGGLKRDTRRSSTRRPPLGPHPGKGQTSHRTCAQCGARLAATPIGSCPEGPRRRARGRAASTAERGIPSASLKHGDPGWRAAPQPALGRNTEGAQGHGQRPGWGARWGRLTSVSRARPGPTVRRLCGRSERSASSWALRTAGVPPHPGLHPPGAPACGVCSDPARARAAEEPRRVPGAPPRWGYYCRPGPKTWAAEAALTQQYRPGPRVIPVPGPPPTTCPAEDSPLAALLGYKRLQGKTLRFYRNLNPSYLKALSASGLSQH